MGTHEEYVQCLELLEYEEELNQAHIIYQHQVEQKLTFGNWKLWRESRIPKSLTGVAVAKVDPLVQVLPHWP